MQAKRGICFFTVLVCLAPALLKAQNWSAGSSPVITSGQSITVNAAEPDIIRFIDNGTLLFTSGGSVTLTGAAVLPEDNHTLIGSGTGASGLLSMTGGTMTKQGGGFFAVGYGGGTGTLSIASGALIDMSATDLYVAANEVDQRSQLSHGTVVIDGTLKCSQLMCTAWFATNLTPPFVEAARLTLNAGGVFETGHIVKNDTALSTLLFNGGTLRFKNNDSNFVNGDGQLALQIADNQSARFDTNGRNVAIYPLAAPLNTRLTLSAAGPLGNGGLIKTGAGTLTFRLSAAENSFTGAIEVVQGTLDLGRAMAAGQRVTVHAGAAFVMYSAADADQVTVLGDPAERLLYTVGADTDTLDLTAINDTFYDDRIGAPLSGAATLSGPLTISAASGISGSPFRLIGQGGTLNLTNTSIESAFVQVEGPGTFNVVGNRSYTSADSGKLLIIDGSYRQSQSFTVADASAGTPAELTLTGGLFNAGTALDVGVSGHGVFHAAGTISTLGKFRIGGASGSTGAVTLSKGTMTANSESWVGFDGGTGTLAVTGGQLIVNGDLRVAGNPGDQTVRALRPEGQITVSNALLRCNVLNFTPWWPGNNTLSTWEAGTLRVQNGAQVEINGVVKNDDPISTILFEGGLLRARGNNSNFLTVSQSYGKLRVLAAAGANAVFDTAGYALTITGSGGSQLIVSGAGGLEKRGTGSLTFSANQVDYAADTVIAGGTLRLGNNNQIPDGVGKGNVAIAANAVLDLNGRAEVINRLTGSGLVSNGNAAVTSVLGVLADGSSDTWTRAPLLSGILLEKLGAGTLTVAAFQGIPTNAIISAGTLRLTTAEGYPSYRFKVEGVRNPGAANAMQFSELALFNGAANVTAARSGIQYDSTGGIGGNAAVNAFPAGEMPEKAVDGIKPPDGTTTGNKWLDFRAAAIRTPEDRDRVWLRINFPSVQKITSYNWATGNDAAERDPAAWRLQGSHDGVEWHDIDVRSGYTATATRNAWVEPSGFSISSENVPEFFRSPATVMLKQGTELLLDNASAGLGALSGLGTVTLNAADLTLNGSQGAVASFGGTIGGSGSLIKTGTGTQSLFGTNAYTGDLLVQQGTLAVLGGTPSTWFRYTVKENRDDVNVTQFSELALYSADGTRRNLNLALGTDVNSLLPGQFATPVNYSCGVNEGPDKLFDNTTGTKWCLIGTVPVLATPSTWRTVVMRLADGTPEITGYNLCTANDRVDRNPVTWSLESSVDGVVWIEVDSRSDAASPATYFTWYNSGTPYTLAERAISSSDADAIPDTAVVEVSAGATLSVANGSEVIGALRVDLLGAGTITRMTPGANGAIYIVNASGSPAGWEIPLTITALDNPADLKSWKLYADGVEQSGYVLRYDPVTGKLSFSAAGTLILIR